jgi:hypothetical protein
MKVHDLRALYEKVEVSKSKEFDEKTSGGSVNESVSKYTEWEKSRCGSAREELMDDEEKDKEEE